MKKFIGLILCLTLAFAMAGCEELETIKNELPPPPSAKNEELSPTAEPASELQTEPEEEFETIPLKNPIIVKNEKTILQEFDPAEGKQLILSFSYDTPKVYIEGRDEVSGKINEYLGILNEQYYSGSGNAEYDEYAPVGYDLMLQEATDNFTYYYENKAEGISLEYSANQDTSVMRADENILSLVFHSSVYKGGAHGSYADFGYVFDTETGDRLGLESIGYDYEDLSSFLINKMVALAEEDREKYYSQRVVTVTPDQYPEVFSELLRESSWYFDNEGMVIFSRTEELGPYAAGIVEFHIPYGELQDKINEKYLPHPRSGEGEFRLSNMSDVSDGSVEIFDKLVKDADGQEICLQAMGNVYDVSLTTVSYAERFYELDQLWYCSEMGGNALQLVTVIPEGVPDLMLKYRDNEGSEHRYLISQSGKDGSFILIDDRIEAVG